MDLVQSVRKDGSRGSQAIGDNVDVEGIRSSNHRENYLGHSILAPVGRSERRRDQMFWARDKPFNIEDDELKKEFKEAQIRERRALNESLGRPIDEGIEELLNPKPSLPAVPSPIPSQDTKERKERRHKHHHRRQHRSRSPRRRHRSGSRSPGRLHHRSRRDRSHSREDRSDRRHRPRYSERDRSRSRERRQHHRERSQDRDERRPRHRERSRDRSPEPHRRRERETSRDRSPVDRRPRYRAREHSEEASSHVKTGDGNYAQRRDREGSHVSDHQRSRRDSGTRY